MQEPPSPDAAPLSATNALDHAASAWARECHARDLPIAVQEAILAELRSCLHQSAAPAGTEFALPHHWPARGHAWAALDALAAFEFHVLRQLAAVPVLQGDLHPFDCVHAMFARVRKALARTAAAQAESEAPALERALEKRDRQLSVATHELRTPLSSILLNLQMLERAAHAEAPVDPASLRRLLEIPMRQLRRLRRMVDMLLDAAQIESDRIVLQPEPVDLCALVKESAARLTPLARERGCVLEAPDCEPVVGRWDRLRMEQVVTNLLSNAIKYGGGAARAAASAHARHAVLVVEDRGAGVAPEDRARIFEPYERLPVTSGEDGAGLGLYIVREIVQAHGGTVEIAARDGGGTTFTVRLPIEQGKVQ